MRNNKTQCAIYMRECATYSIQLVHINESHTLNYGKMNEASIKTNIQSKLKKSFSQRNVKHVRNKIKQISLHHQFGWTYHEMNN